jgi:hypothetical protein
MDARKGFIAELSNVSPPTYGSLIRMLVEDTPHQRKNPAKIAS